ncbi:MAG TPA: DUF4136 domain-containing protein [Sphingomonadaceae bacterium]
MRIARSLVFGALALAVSGPALAQWGPWGGGPYGPYAYGGWGRPGWREPIRSTRDDREGKVEVTRFLGQDAAGALGHGQIAVQVTANDVKAAGAGTAFASELPDKAPKDYGPSDERAGHDADNHRNDATYEAAVIDQLVKLGYDTTAPAPAQGQLVELTITRSVLQPPEPPHKPVSGEMDVGVSNRGSAVGGALFLDFTKPAKALISTRLEARIRDRATGNALWEGRADIATRDGDSAWSEQKIATRLADALFGGFPGKSGETVVLR